MDYRKLSKETLAIRIDELTEDMKNLLFAIKNSPTKDVGLSHASTASMVYAPILDVGEIRILVDKYGGFPKLIG